MRASKESRRHPGFVLKPIGGYWYLDGKTAGGTDFRKNEVGDTCWCANEHVKWTAGQKI